MKTPESIEPGKGLPGEPVGLLPDDPEIALKKEEGKDRRAQECATG
ncbi:MULTISPECIES: hypothetical protein [Polaromonas]|uniref:Uncharacterized protein n=1 Tax=Polaromonas aquatica TaxID=332657 RepID=A0ABW1U170_9BURK